MNITSATFILSGTDLSHFPEPSLPEILLLGRSNVGKSSFINGVLNRHQIARTSQRPGKTQTLNYFLINEALYFVDAPGYGYARVSHRQKEQFGVMIENYISHRETHALTFLLVDFRHKPTEDDLLMLNYLRYFEKRIVIICTKKDKVKRSLHDKQKKMIRETLMLNPDEKMIVCSAETKEGFMEVKEVMASLISA